MPHPKRNHLPRSGLNHGSNQTLHSLRHRRQSTSAKNNALDTEKSDQENFQVEWIWHLHQSTLFSEVNGKQSTNRKSINKDETFYLNSESKFQSNSEDKRKNFYDFQTKFYLTIQSWRRKSTNISSQTNDINDTCKKKVQNLRERGSILPFGWWDQARGGGHPTHSLPQVQ